MDRRTFLQYSLASGTVYQFDIASGNLLQTFDSGRIGISVAGLAVFGEPTQGTQSQATAVPEPSEALGTLVLGAGYIWGREARTF